MKIERLKEAIVEAKRFIKKANDVSNIWANGNLCKSLVETGCKETAACKRASMDLSRALSELRKP